VGALGSVDEETIRLQGVVAAPDGSRVLRISAIGEDPWSLGAELAHKALTEGADRLLQTTVVK
jgi:hydroxymethylbilane synthase